MIRRWRNAALFTKRFVFDGIGQSLASRFAGQDHVVVVEKQHTLLALSVFIFGDNIGFIL
jgi:hypothetical protein